MTEVEQPPMLLAGRYELGEHIGRGGMADVHKGRDIRLGRDVAVKVLRRDLARDPSFQARFRREAQAAASLAAPSIVSVYDTGEDPDGVPYIVMEHVAGRTLREVLQEEGRLLPTRALEVTADLCTALAVAHAAGIVHRDIKPANVMLTPDGEVKVMDFGIARAVADTSGVTQTAAVIGTAAYLSPEQARGEQVDARSDLYSTGCLLYEILTGSPPFRGESPVAVAYQHVREQPEAPSAHDPSLPPAVDAVVLKAIAKSAADRYQSATEMREDVLRARAGEAVVAPPARVRPARVEPPVAPVVTRRRRRTPRGLHVAFVLLLAAVVAGTALLVREVVGPTAALVPAPDLVGLDQREAVAELAQEGLRVGRVSTSFNNAPFGTVLRQTPPQGIVVPADGAVELLVSKGVETATVPAEVVGLPRDEAEVLLADRKLEVDDVVTRDGLHPPGTVLAVTPAPGQQLPAGSSVALTVASGRVPVPDVRGRTQDQAVEALQNAGFSVRVLLRYADGAPGRVLQQDPSGGLRQAGSTVEVVVAERLPEPEPAPGPEPGPAVEPDPAPPAGEDAAAPPGPA